MRERVVGNEVSGQWRVWRISSGEALQAIFSIGTLILRFHIAVGLEGW